MPEAFWSSFCDNHCRVVVREAGPQVPKGKGRVGATDAQWQFDALKRRKNHA